ncbi:ABC transporter ATP-binding protein [Jiangella endophytica]|uniref:ABC transporter ATP-binding protein n=1 Tax=Jiangella endophytica TaxID=1623398 RepID=UPI001300BA9D|nr:ATP-binding cassette domain-containing protein [Jiangella endophytica]
MSPAPVLSAAGLRKTYGELVVVDDLTFDVPGGGVVALVGPNGAGKSTLLECLAGAAPLDAGAIAVGGVRSDPSSAAHWRQVFGILDDFTWLPDLTVADHLVLMSGDRGAEAVDAALERFGVAGQRDRLPESLSAGQRRRAALAAARVRPWRVLLLDEPEQHLDADGIDLLADELVSMATPDRCILLSSHAAGLVDRLGCPVLDLTRSGRT